MSSARRAASPSTTTCACQPSQWLVFGTWANFVPALDAATERLGIESALDIFALGVLGRHVYVKPPRHGSVDVSQPAVCQHAEAQG